MTYRRCLCESGQEVVFAIVTLILMGFTFGVFSRNHSGLYACYDFRWRLIHSVMHESLISKHQKFNDSFCDWETYKITPIAYSEQAQTKYLQLPGIVVSFSFDHLKGHE